MRPYYDQEGITIYHADSRDVLPMTCDHVITDPPYGLMETGGKVQMRGEVVDQDYGDWDLEWSFDWMKQLPATIKSAVVFHDQKRASDCWQAFLLSGITPRQYLYWDKGDGGLNPRHNFVNVMEQALYGRRGTGPWNGGASTVNVFRRNRSKRTTDHPTEKPEDLMAWIVRVVTDPNEVILDPFMGSGTTLVAAKRLGRRAIGIEMNEAYCEGAAARLAQGALAL
jgi:DNA modification methylase